MASLSKAPVLHLEAAVFASLLFGTATAAFFCLRAGREPGVDRELAGGGLRDPRVLKAFEALLSWIDTGLFPWVHGDLARRGRRPKSLKALTSSFWAWGSNPDLEIAPGLRTSS